jgi:hypothetical protein
VWVKPKGLFLQHLAIDSPRSRFMSLSLSLIPFQSLLKSYHLAHHLSCYLSTQCHGLTHFSDSNLDGMDVGFVADISVHHV